jgi:DNA repair protein RadB
MTRQPARVSRHIVSDGIGKKIFGGVLGPLFVPGSVTGISTGCGPIDDLLGGGLERGTITQVYGPPASGKTNVALGATVGVAAAGDRALYIDTEGLSVDRLGQLADARDAEGLADRIIVSEAYDFAEQREAVADAGDLAEQVELIVLDSATGFYRLERTEAEEGEALRGVARQLTSLLALARRHDLAIAVTNQVYTDPESDQARPLGGHTLAHWTGIILRLERFRGGNRRATLEKHHARETGGSVRFRITGEGLAGAEDPTRVG